LHTGPLALAYERGRHVQLGPREVVAGADRVQAVVGDVDALDRCRHGIGIGGVGTCHLHLLRPGGGPDPVGVAHHDAHPVTGGQQLGDQAPTQVAGWCR